MRFLLEDCSIDSSSICSLGSDEYNTDQSISADYEAFPLFLTIAGNHVESFKLLWLDYGYFWDQSHIIACLKILHKLTQQNRKSQYIEQLLNSETSKEIFSFLDINAKVDFIRSIDQIDESLKSECIEYMKNKPYRWAYIVYKTQKAYKLESEDLDKIAVVMIDLEKDEHETLQSEKFYAPSRVDDMMKSISKLEDSNEDNFNIIKTWI